MPSKKASVPFVKAGIAVAAVVLIAVVAMLWRDDGKKKLAAADAAAALCAQSGGKLDKARNECVCGSGQQWSGSKCEPLVAFGEPPELPRVAAGAATVQELPGASAVHEMDAATAAMNDAADARPEATGPSTPVPALLVPANAEHAEAEEAPLATGRVRRDCQAAKGIWIEADGYCHCDSDRVLVGRRCLPSTGSVTRDLCLRASRAGKWLKGACVCEGPTMIFSPGRGGCVAMRVVSEPTQRRLCETSLNRGKWDARNHRCACPRGRVWTSELCQKQNDLSSEQVCESDFNQGRWESAQKRCECPAGRMWIDQVCRRVESVDARVACAAEVNGGVWNEAKNECTCPRGGKWYPAAKLCGRR